MELKVFLIFENKRKKKVFSSEANNEINRSKYFIEEREIAIKLEIYGTINYLERPTSLTISYKYGNSGVLDRSYTHATRKKEMFHLRSWTKYLRQTLLFM